MPLWRIFSHPSTFSPSQRSGLAKAITELYVSRGLPAFYVVVLFIDQPDDDGKNPSTFVGGAPHANFVRVVIEQIARTMSSPETEEGRKARKGWMDTINEVSSIPAFNWAGLDDVFAQRRAVLTGFRADCSFGRP